MAMAPKCRRPDADPDHMTLSFRAKKRPSSTCIHPSEISIEVAGMSRSVCESCGRVSLVFVDNHYKDRADEIEARSLAKR